MEWWWAPLCQYTTGGKQPGLILEEQISHKLELSLVLLLLLSLIDFPMIFPSASIYAVLTPAREWSVRGVVRMLCLEPWLRWQSDRTSELRRLLFLYAPLDRNLGLGLLL